MNNKAVVKGDAIIKNVSGHTFNNLGTVINIIIEDTDASSLFNEGTISGKIKVTKPSAAQLIIKGIINCEVSIEADDAKVKVDNGTSINKICILSKKVELNVEGKIDNLQISDKATESKINLDKNSNINNILADQKTEISGEGLKNILQDKIKGKASSKIKEKVKQAQKQLKDQDKTQDEEERQKQKKIEDSKVVQEVKDTVKLGNLNNITNNINLPKNIKGVLITWDSSNKNVIDGKGNVVRPSATKGDAIVTLTAKFAKGEVKDEKSFIVTVKSKEFTDEELVNLAYDNLKLEGNLDSIIDNLKFITKDEKTNVQIDWSSSNETVVSRTGIVKRSDKDQKIKLTAILKKGSINKRKVFDIIVKAKEKDTQEALKLIVNSLEISNKDSIEKDINLATNLDGVTITWKSSNESVVSNTGKVTRPQLGQEDAHVILTATVTKDGKTETKQFTVTVEAEKELVANDKDEFYNILKDSLENFKTNVVIRIPNYNENDYSINMLSRLVTEHPEIDYGYEGVDSKISVTKGKQVGVLTINIKYRLSKQRMIEEKSAVKDKVKQILSSQIKDEMTTVDKELALHDYIVKNAEYDVEHVNDEPPIPEDHNAYGVLVKGIGVCESYAKAMYELLNEAGIECKYVTGDSKHDGVKDGGHAWNMVKLDDGQWYNLDATWDDPVSDRNGADNTKKNDDWTPVIHSYFNVPDSIFNKDHIRGEFEENNYPKCTATKYSYDNLDVKEYAKDGKLINKVSTIKELDEQILLALKNKEQVAYFKIKNIDSNVLSEEIQKVIDNNSLNTGIKSWQTSLISSYLKYTFKYN